MREIKFRAWNKTVNKFTYFGKKEPIITSAEVPNGKSVGMFLSADKQIYLTPYEDPQQFTEIRDKSEKQIYEGDILKIRTFKGFCKGKVVFNKGCFWALVKEFNSVENDLFPLHDNEGNTKFEVIGNINENPDLLEK